MVKRSDEVMNIAGKTIKMINKKFVVRSAYLFGSYAEGNAHEYSDIDIAVFADGVADLTLEQKIELGYLIFDI